jgi:geranylgeranyl diphosphate synthase, type I
MSLQEFIDLFIPEIEAELSRVVELSREPHFNELHKMMSYHMGWEGEGAGPKARGKRVRPLLVLLTCAAAGCDWHDALPAAAAVELVHNFSLIHDDIEDNSDLRRGRPTVWKIWGLAQGINAGDTMFTLAHMAVLRLEETSTLPNTLEAASILQQTCLQLTQGQYLDISYEDRQDLTIKNYWPMVGGKTAALLATCTKLGALVADVDDHILQSYYQFGRNLGLAFQALDDFLGIWGDADKIGKSTASDLIEGKKSLPVLFGIEQGGEFARRWTQGPISPEEVPEVAAQLEAEGGREYTKQVADRYTQRALTALQDAGPQGSAGEALSELAHQLLKRRA